MAVVTFVNSIEEKTGKTMAVVAIATNMAIDKNSKILIISTTNKEDNMKSCFFEEKQVKKLRLGIFGENKSNIVESDAGIEGIAKIIRSNKLRPEIITNYTKVVFKDRLEIILGANPKGKQKNDLGEYSDEKEKPIQEEYLELISIANNYYDYVFVDLDDNIDENVRKKIIQMSNLVVINVSQHLNSFKKLQEIKENGDELLNSTKSLILVGRYDRNSKYNAKNITRYLDEKNQILTIPYNTLFFEASDEASVPDFMLSMRKVSDSEDKNVLFMQEVKRATENIIYRLQELQMRY